MALSLFNPVSHAPHTQYLPVTPHRDLSSLQLHALVSTVFTFSSDLPSNKHTKSAHVQMEASVQGRIQTFRCRGVSLWWSHSTRVGNSFPQGRHRGWRKFFNCCNNRENIISIPHITLHNTLIPSSQMSFPLTDHVTRAHTHTKYSKRQVHLQKRHHILVISSLYFHFYLEITS